MVIKTKIVECIDTSMYVMHHELFPFPRFLFSFRFEKGSLILLHPQVKGSCESSRSHGCYCSTSTTRSDCWLRQHSRCFWDHALCLNQSSSKCQWLQGCTFTEMILQWHMASRHGANPKQNVGETGTVKFKKDTAKWKLWIKGNAGVRKGSEEQWTWAVSWREWNIQMGRQPSHELHYQNIQVSSPYV